MQWTNLPTPARKRNFIQSDYEKTLNLVSYKEIIFLKTIDPAFPKNILTLF